MESKVVLMTSEGDIMEQKNHCSASGDEVISSLRFWVIVFFIIQRGFSFY